MPGRGSALRHLSRQRRGRADEWHRDQVAPSSTVVSSRRLLALQVEPGNRLHATTMVLYEDAEARWFYDEEATLPFDESVARWWWWVVASGVAVGLGVTGWLVWRRRRRPLS